MNRPRISATSRAANDSDQRKRDLAWEILRESNAVVVDFAKLMVPTALTAVGVIIGLAQATERDPTNGASRLLILIACALALGSALLFAHAAYARPVRVSLEDYDDVMNEILTAAASRQRETSFALFILTLAAATAVFDLVR